MSNILCCLDALYSTTLSCLSFALRVRIPEQSSIALRLTQYANRGDWCVCSFTATPPSKLRLSESLLVWPINALGIYFFIFFCSAKIGQRQFHTGARCMLVQQSEEEEETATNREDIQPAIISTKLYAVFRKKSQISGLAVTVYTFRLCILQCSSANLFFFFWRLLIHHLVPMFFFLLAECANTNSCLIIS